MGKGDGSHFPFGNHFLAQPLASMLLMFSDKSVDHVLLITSKPRSPACIKVILNYVARTLA